MGSPGISTERCLCLQDPPGRPLASLSFSFLQRLGPWCGWAGVQCRAGLCSAHPSMCWPHSELGLRRGWTCWPVDGSTHWCLLGCSSAVPRSPLYMLQSLSAFISCHCNHPKKKLLIGANLLQPMTGARCTLWWVRRRCKTGLKRFSGPDSFILPLLWLKDVAERMGRCPCSGLWNPRYHPPLKLRGCWLLPVKHSRYEKLFAVTVQKVFTAHL